MKRLLKKLTTRLIIIILALLAVSGSEASAAWYDDNWAYRQAVTVVSGRMRIV